MNGSNSGASASGGLKPLVVIAAVLILPLTGCMSTGASTFANSLAIDEATGSIPADSNSMQAIPMDVATSDPQTPLAAAPANPAKPPIQIAGIQDDRQPQNIEALTEPVDTRSGAANRQLASLAPAPSAPQAQEGNSPILVGLPSATTPAETAYDQAEAAAEARIPPLYASIDHGQCKGGWGPKPLMINAKRIVPGQHYYMEMRLRHTPPLPVGHVYIAYGRLGPDGNPLDEKLVMLAPVGGYSGAAVAAAVPMPGVMKPYGDDCVLRPIAAYRISLSAQQYEKLLLQIEKEKELKPSYALFAYNCNHFMSDVAKSVGILPPKNIYTPSLTYFYDMMDRNEGHRVARTAEELRVASASAFPTQ